MNKALTFFQGITNGFWNVKQVYIQFILDLLSVANIFHFSHDELYHCVYFFADITCEYMQKEGQR